METLTENKNNSIGCLPVLYIFTALSAGFFDGADDSMADIAGLDQSAAFWYYTFR